MDEELEKLIRLFEHAAALIERELLSAIGDEEPDRSRRQRLVVINGILASLRRAALGEGDESRGRAWEVIRAAYLEGLEVAQEGLRDRGESGGDLTGIDLRAARVLYESLSDSLEDAIAYVGRRANDILRRATLSEVLAGQVAGRSRRATAAALAESLRERGVSGFRDIAGREWSLARYAAMAAHTTAREAATTATLNRLAENGIDLVEWRTRPTVGERRACDLCRPRNGEVYSITGANEDYPALVDAPPLHPNCGCLVVAYVPALRR